MSRSSWELLISAERRVKYRPRVLTAFDTNSTLRVLPDGAWIRWKCLVAGPGVRPTPAYFSKYLVKASYSFFKLRKNLSNVEKVKLFKPVDTFIDWDEGSYEWCWRLKVVRFIRWNEKLAFAFSAPAQVEGPADCWASCDHPPCPHHDHIDFLLLPRHRPRPGHCPHPHVSPISIILRTRAENIRAQKICNFTRQKYSI